MNLAELDKKNFPKGKPAGRKTVVRSFSIPPKLLRELEKTAKEESRTYSELVREAIRQYIKTKQIEETRMQNLSRGRAATAAPREDGEPAGRAARHPAAKPRGRRAET